MTRPYSPGKWPTWCASMATPLIWRYGATVSPEQHRALRAIAVCRTATPREGTRRNVSSVGTGRSPRTPVAIGMVRSVQAAPQPPQLAAREAELLDVPYVHVCYPPPYPIGARISWKS